MSARTVGNRTLVWTIVGSHFGPPFMFSGVAVALPQLDAELHAGALSLGLIETTFLAGGLAFLLPAGRLADAGDKGTLFRFGLLAFGALSLAIAASSSVPLIVLLRFLQGAVSALFAATSAALLADLVPLAQRGRVFGASMGVVYAGLTLGPVAAGGLVAAFGWRAVFVVGAAVILAGAGLVARHLPMRWRRPPQVVHRPSVALVVAASLAATFGSAGLQHGWPGWVGLGIATALAAVFVAVQLRVARPLLDLRALRANGPLGAALLVQLVLYLNAYCSMFLLSLFLQVTLGRSPPAAGAVLALSGVVMAVVAPLAGALSDRLPRRLVTAAGAGAVLVSALLARTLDAGSTTGAVRLVLVLQGLGFGLFSSPNMAIIMASMPKAQSGMASALAAKARSIGMVTGMVLTQSLIALDLGARQPREDPVAFAATVSTIYTVLACTAALGLGVTLSGRRADPE
ncbi:MAG: MFS transporter [Planctomycetota bacterium]